MKIDNPKITGTLQLVGDNATSDLSGSFSGSFQGDGSGLTGVLTASYAENASGQVIETPTVSQSFADVTSVTISHGFGTRNVLVSVYDNAFTQFIPDSVTLTDTNTVDVNFISERSGIVVVAKGGHIVSGSTDNAVNLNGQPGSFYLDYNNFTNIPESGTTLDVGTTAEREPNPSVGRLRYNTSTQNLEMYDGNIWVAFQNNSYIDTEVVNTSMSVFNGLATYTRQLDFISIDAEVFNSNVRFLEIEFNLNYSIYGGGGGGSGGVSGEWFGSGGASGVNRTGTITTNNDQLLSIVIGAGGSGNTGNGGSGSNTTITSGSVTYTALGGNGSSRNSATGASNEDYSGGSGRYGDYSYGAGGGAGAGANGNDTGLGHGGTGAVENLTGNSFIYGGGGGGYYGSDGGDGGGGNANGGNADQYTGSGGAGGSASGGGGNGAGGMVILSYPNTVTAVLSNGATSLDSGEIDNGNFKYIRIITSGDIIFELVD